MTPPKFRPDRNGTCWCGSGVKYKKCHMRSDEEAGRAEAAVQTGGAPSKTPPQGNAIYGWLFQTLMHAGEQWDPNLTHGRQAARLFYGPDGAAKLGPDEDGGFGKWYLCGFRAGEGAETIAERYLRERGAQLEPRARALLESWRDGFVSLYEVQSVEPARGVEFKDLCGGSPERMFIHDVNSSRSLVKWDCVLCRVEYFEDKWALGANGMRVPRPVVADFLAMVNREGKRVGKPAAAWVRERAERLNASVLELFNAQNARREVRNYEGDVLEFSSANYRVLDEEAAVAGLRGCREFELQDEDGEPGTREFAWLQADSGDSGDSGDNVMRRSFGRIEIGDGGLRLECNSRERLERGRRLVEEHAGLHLAHQRDAFESVEAAMKRRKSEGPAEELPPSIPPEIAKAVIAQYKERHYATWPDQPLPALQGKSPREAMRTKPGRTAVAALLRDMENSEARAAGGAAYDFSKLRASLGLGPDE